jgi:myo-inositol-hexaphosphate 3-phosphohydrolase
MLEFILKVNGELIDGYQEKVGRETNSPLGRKLSYGLTIYKDGESQDENIGMDQADEGRRKIHSVKRRNNEVLVDAIEGLGKI